MPEKGVCEMLWCIALVVGFMACLVVIIALGTESTARYEMERRQLLSAQGTTDPVTVDVLDPSTDNPVAAAV